MPFAAGAFAEALKFLKQLKEGGNNAEILQEIMNNLGDPFAAQFAELVGNRTYPHQAAERAPDGEGDCARNQAQAAVGVRC